MDVARTVLGKTSDVLSIGLGAISDAAGIRLDLKSMVELDAVASVMITEERVNISGEETWDI